METRRPRNPRGSSCRRSPSPLGLVDVPEYLALWVANGRAITMARSAGDSPALLRSSPTITSTRSPDGKVHQRHPGEHGGGDVRLLTLTEDDRYERREALRRPQGRKRCLVLKS